MRQQQRQQQHAPAALVPDSSLTLAGYSAVEHVQWCTGGSLPAASGILGAGVFNDIKHCPLLGKHTPEKGLALVKAWCDSHPQCKGFTAYITHSTDATPLDVWNPGNTGPKRFCVRSTISGVEEDPDSPATCYVKGSFPTSQPTAQPPAAPPGSQFISTTGKSGRQLELVQMINELHKGRAYRSTSDHWGVPLYVVTLGGHRFEMFKKEMEAEKHPFTLVPQSKRPLETDYPEPKGSAGVMGCTRAHFSFAQMLLKRGDRCAVVAEDDACFALSPHWPVSLSDLCDKMFQKDPKWTTLTLYSSDIKSKPKSGGFGIYKYTEGTWGTVAYLATQRWTKIMVALSKNNTRLMRSEIQSKYGTADSAVYAFKGSSGYVLYPDYVFPNNAQVLTGSHIAQGENSFTFRDEAHIVSSLNVVKTSLGHFKDHAKSVSETPVADTKVAPISEPAPSPPPEEAQAKAPAPSQPASYSTIEQTPEPKLTKSEGPPKLPAGAKLGTEQFPVDVVTTSALDNTPSVVVERSRNNNELYWLIISVWKNAPWVRTIWVLVNGVVESPYNLPAGVDVKFYDRCIHMKKENCPTKNGWAVRYMVHRIPGLAEHFISLDDDVFFGRPVTPSDFFTADGKPYVWAKVPGFTDGLPNEQDHPIYRKPAVFKGKIPTSNGPGPHWAYPMLKSFAAQLDNTYSEWFEFVESHKTGRYDSNTDSINDKRNSCEEQLEGVWMSMLLREKIGVFKSIREKRYSMRDECGPTSFSACIKHKPKFLNVNDRFSKSQPIYEKQIAGFHKAMRTIFQTDGPKLKANTNLNHTNLNQ